MSLATKLQSLTSLQNRQLYVGQTYRCTATLHRFSSHQHQKLFEIWWYTALMWKWRWGHRNHFDRTHIMFHAELCGLLLRRCNLYIWVTLQVPKVTQHLNRRCKNHHLALFPKYSCTFWSLHSVPSHLYHYAHKPWFSIQLFCTRRLRCETRYRTSTNSWLGPLRFAW